jgi:hypothetical protein
LRETFLVLTPAPLKSPQYHLPELRGRPSSQRKGNCGSENLYYLSAFAPLRETVFPHARFAQAAKPAKFNNHNHFFPFPCSERQSADKLDMQHGASYYEAKQIKE